MPVEAGKNNVIDVILHDKNAVDGKKVCTKCGFEKPVSDYGISLNKKNDITYRSGSCRGCDRIESKEYYKKNVEKRLRYASAYSSLKRKNPEWLKSRRDYHRKRNVVIHYGISFDEYSRMHDVQGGLCAICRKPEMATYKGEPRLLCVDHDHETKKVRAFLCSACNFAIGGLKENIELFERAIEYLRKYKGV